jgi:hypothetical protein
MFEHSLIVVLLFHLFCIFQEPQKFENCRTWEGLIGNVRSVKTHSVMEKNNREFPEGGDTLSIFNQNGLKDKTIHYLSDGSLSRTIIYIYDHKNRLFEEASTDSKGQPSNKKKYHYDENNKTIEIYKYDANQTLSSRVVYIFDSEFLVNPCLDENVLSGEDRLQTWRERKTYNKDGGISSVIQASNNGYERTKTYSNLKNGKTVDTYDESGKITLRRFFGEKNDF